MKNKYITELIEDLEKDIVKNEVQAWLYLQESLNPKKMGRATAETNMAIHQKRVEDLKKQILAYRAYDKDHDNI